MHLDHADHIPASPDAAPLLVVAPARKPRRRPVSTPWPLCDKGDARRGLLAALTRVRHLSAHARYAMTFVRAAARAKGAEELAEIHACALADIAAAASYLASIPEAARYFGTVATLLTHAAEIGERLELFHGRVRP